MNRRHAWVLSVVVAASACSPKKFVVKQAADALSSSSDSTLFTGDDDPELVRDSLPTMLKAMEALAEQQPEHSGLRATLASSFMTYAYAFVQQEADMAEARSLAEAQAGWMRCRRLYRRAHGYAMQGLEIRHGGFTNLFKRNPEAAVLMLGREDAELVYYAGASLAAEIVVSKDKPDVVAELPQVGHLMNRLLALDEDWNGGAVHSFMVSYEGRSPAMGGSPERARQHFDRAVALAQGRKASLFVSWAEQTCVAQQDMACFNTWLDKALAIDVDAHRPTRLENMIFQKRARWLKARATDLIDVPDATEATP
jgi:predicted anti-sigma-YlaC factor YlaD